MIKPRLKTIIFFNFLSLALIFSASYLNGVSFAESWALNRDQLLEMVNRAIGLSILAALLMSFLVSRLKHLNWVLAVTGFLFLNALLNIFSQPILNLGYASFFIFHNEPMFDHFIGFDIVILVLSAGTACWINRKKAWAKASLLFFCIALISLFSEFHQFLLQNPDDLHVKSGEDISFFQFSKTKKNTLVILADGFGGSTFSKMIEQKLTAPFTGFVFYKNTLSRFTGTAGNAPEMLGGPEYSYFKLRGSSKPWFEYYFEANRALDAKLKAIGSGFASIDVPPEISPEVLARDIARNSFLFSFVKIAPSWIKKHFYFKIRDNPDLPGRQKWGLLLHFLKQASLGESSRVKYLHIQVPHPANFMPVDCRLDTVTDYQPTNYATESKCFIHYLDLLFQRLKDLGVYDSTEIYVISDHGWTGEDSDYSADIHDLDKIEPFKRINFGFAHSLFLIKRQNASGPLQVDINHFLSSADLYAFLCGSHNGCSDLPHPLTLQNRTMPFYVGTVEYHLQHVFQVKNNLFERKNWELVK